MKAFSQNKIEIMKENGLYLQVRQLKIKFKKKKKNDLKNYS